MTKTLTVEHFSEIASTIANLYIRRGQAMMNKLSELSMEIYLEITDHRKCNPFFNDERIPDFLAYLVTNHLVTGEAPKLGLRPDTIRVGQFYKTRNKDVSSSCPNIVFLGTQTHDFKKRLVIIAPGLNENGKVVAEPPIADREHWDSFYEVDAPKFS